MSASGDDIPRQDLGPACPPAAEASLAPSLKAGALTAVVVVGGAVAASNLSLGALSTGLLLGALAGLTAAIAIRLCAGRIHDDAGYVAGALHQLHLPADAETDGGRATAAMGDLRQAFESAAQRVARLAEQESFMRAVADTAHGVEALFGLDGRLLWVNPSVYRLTGHTEEACRAAPDLLELLVHPSDRGHVRTQARLAAEGGSGQEQELRLQHRVRGTVPVLCHWRPFLGAQGRQEGVRLSVEDISARKEAEFKFLETVAELRRAQALSEHYLSRSGDERQRMAALLNVLRLGILFMDRDSRVQYFNRALLRIWGYPDEENLLGMRDIVLQSRVAHLLVDPDAYLAHLRRVTEDRVSEPYEITLADGRILTDISTVVEGVDGQGAIGRVWIYEDVTEARRISHQLVEMAERDPLTNLYNRRRFHEELERVLAEATRRGEEVGLVVLDLDGFKPINDRYGHQAGDEVLVTLGRELGRVVRRNEMFFRLGGDEFAILASDADEVVLAELARRVVERTASLRFSFGGAEEVGVTASLGLALYPCHARDGEHLMAVADAAMYRAKVAGRNRWSMAAGTGMSSGSGG
jgi:diguanylate cyclase (GGDEF)-like protein/PAS domain S-box-containing protein